jgi:hypothetical protein
MSGWHARFPFGKTPRSCPAPAWKLVTRSDGNALGRAAAGGRVTTSRIPSSVDACDGPSSWHRPSPRTLPGVPERSVIPSLRHRRTDSQTVVVGRQAPDPTSGKWLLCRSSSASEVSITTGVQLQGPEEARSAHRGPCQLQRPSSAAPIGESRPAQAWCTSVTSPGPALQDHRGLSKSTERDAGACSGRCLGRSQQGSEEQLSRSATPHWCSPSAQVAAPSD